MNNVLEEKIGKYIKMFAAGVFAILFIYLVYDNNRSKEQIKVSSKTKDSLESLINKYEFDYTVLKKRADELDSVIKVRKDSILIIKQKIYIYRDKEIKNPDEATKYIINFLKD